METLELIKSFIVIFGIIGPTIILFYMLLFISIKRCPLCGGKMEARYGSGVVGYTCKNCKNIELKILN
jgi:tRNA(Ile2) C34 agmatinyltransferase TiaS